MSQLSDWTKRRQEYLAAQRETAVDLILLVGWTVYTGTFMVKCALQYAHQRSGGELLLSLLLGMATCVYLCHIRRTYSSLKAIPYVPRVTAHGLHASEILVRSSVEPSWVARERLLRAVENRARGDQDLLRMCSQ